MNSNTMSIDNSDKDVGVVGFGDTDLAILSEPSLTTLAYDPKQIGREAASLLLKCLDDSARPVEHIRIQPGLVVRDSGRKKNARRNSTGYQI